MGRANDLYHWCFDQIINISASKFFYIDLRLPQSLWLPSSRNYRFSFSNDIMFPSIYRQGIVLTGPVYKTASNGRRSLFDSKYLWFPKMLKKLLRNLKSLKKKHASGGPYIRLFPLIFIPLCWIESGRVEKNAANGLDWMYHAIRSPARCAASFTWHCYSLVFVRSSDWNRMN